MTEWDGPASMYVGNSAVRTGVPEVLYLLEILFLGVLHLYNRVDWMGQFCGTIRNSVFLIAPLLVGLSTTTDASPQTYDTLVKHDLGLHHGLTISSIAIGNTYEITNLKGWHCRVKSRAVKEERERERPPPDERPLGEQPLGRICLKMTKGGRWGQDWKVLVGNNCVFHQD